MTTTLSANGAGRRITTHEAQVKTATVEIKALTISGKQVTLAVFRQLQEEDLIDPVACEIRGVPWGTVNYHSDKACADIGEHLHVVWQKGVELRRSTVREYHEFYAAYSDACSREFAAMVCCKIMDLLSESGSGSSHARVAGEFRRADEEAFRALGVNYIPAGQYEIYGDRNVWLTIDGVSVTATVPRRPVDLEYAKKHSRPSVRVSPNPPYEEVEQESTSVEIRRDALRRKVAVFKKWRHGYKQQYGALANLDQLFVAV